MQNRTFKPYLRFNKLKEIENFTFDDIVDISGITRGAARDWLKNMLRKRYVNRLRKIRDPNYVYYELTEKAINFIETVNKAKTELLRVMKTKKYNNVFSFLDSLKTKNKKS